MPTQPSSFFIGPQRTEQNSNEPRTPEPNSLFARVGPKPTVVKNEPMSPRAGNYFSALFGPKPTVADTQLVLNNGPQAQENAAQMDHRFDQSSISQCSTLGNSYNAHLSASQPENCSVIHSIIDPDAESDMLVIAYIQENYGSAPTYDNLQEALLLFGSHMMKQQVPQSEACPINYPVMDVYAESRKVVFTYLREHYGLEPTFDNVMEALIRFGSYSLLMQGKIELWQWRVPAYNDRLKTNHRILVDRARADERAKIASEIKDLKDVIAKNAVRENDLLDVITGLKLQIPAPINLSTIPEHLQWTDEEAAHHNDRENTDAHLARLLSSDYNDFDEENPYKEYSKGLIKRPGIPTAVPGVHIKCPNCPQLKAFIGHLTADHSWYSEFVNESGLKLKNILFKKEETIARLDKDVKKAWKKRSEADGRTSKVEQERDAARKSLEQKSREIDVQRNEIDSLQFYKKNYEDLMMEKVKNQETEKELAKVTQSLKTSKNIEQNLMRRLERAVDFNKKTSVAATATVYKPSTQRAMLSHLPSDFASSAISRRASALAPLHMVSAAASAACRRTWVTRHHIWASRNPASPAGSEHATSEHSTPVSINQHEVLALKQEIEKVQEEFAFVSTHGLEDVGSKPEIENFYGSSTLISADQCQLVGSKLMVEEDQEGQEISAGSEIEGYTIAATTVIPAAFAQEGFFYFVAFLALICFLLQCGNALLHIVTPTVQYLGGNVVNVAEVVCGANGVCRELFFTPPVDMYSSW